MHSGPLGYWRRNIHSPSPFCDIDTGAGERRSMVFSYLGRALHCSEGKVMPSSVWQKTCLCCTARRGPMQGPLHWERETRDICTCNVSQVQGEAAVLRLHGTQVQGLV